MTKRGNLQKGGFLWVLEHTIDHEVVD